MSVYYYKAYGKWAAELTHSGRRHFLGYFAIKEQAEAAVEAKHDELGRPVQASLEEQLLAQREIDPATGCWNWTGHTVGGYGRISAYGPGQRSVRGLPRGTKVGRGKEYFVPRVAAMLWKGFSLNDPRRVLHTCDNPPCFNPDHLYIGTQADNARDRSQRRRGRENDQDGYKNPNAKLTESDVVEIIRLVREERLSQTKVASQFDISQAQIQRIVAGKAWRMIA